MDESRRRGRRSLLILAAIFLLPVFVAFALYYGKLWRPAGSASKGELIEPARPLDGVGPASTPMADRPVRRRIHRQVVAHLYR